MPKFKIELVQTVTEGCTLYVEADDQEAAENKALLIAYGEHPDAQDRDKCPLWNFIEVVDDAEVVMAEEWPPERDEPPQGIVTTVMDLGASGGGTDSRAVVVDHMTGEVINLMDALRATIKEGE
jgi:hypothetical protein